MKKLFAILLALVMVMSLSVTAFAAEATVSTGDKTIDVTAKYNDATTTPDVYSVDISWENMTFTYTAEGTKTWNPQTHEYTISDGSNSFDAKERKITLINHSNVEVTAYFSFDAEAGFSGKFSSNQITLAAGVEGDPAGAACESVAFSLVTWPDLSGAPKAGMKAGTITITIS